jgi:hypothetical protein
LVVGIIVEIVTKIRIGPFANGFEEGNPIVTGVTTVTLGATRCMNGTYATSIVEIK